MPNTRRPALGLDREFVRLVHHRAYRDVVERQFGFWDVEQQDEFFNGDWLRGGIEIIEADGEGCGYVAIKERDECVLIRELVIDPRFQGRGIGTLVLSEAVELGTSRGIPVRIGALHQNRNIGLYRRLGYVEIGRDDTHVFLEHRPHGAG